jgi:hypothetical protein
MSTLQFHIKAAQSEDERRVAEIFASAAETFHLSNIKVTSRAEHTICNYSDGVAFEFGLGAWRVGDLIVVQFNPGKGATDKFYAVFDFVVTLLRTTFEDRLAVATAENYVKVPNTLPTSDTARAIYRGILNKANEN